MSRGPDRQATKLLMIDPSFLAARMLAAVLADNPDITCESQPDLDGALGVLEGYLPTVLLLSWSQDEGGLKTLRALRRHPATEDVPVVVLSAREDAAARDQALAAGAADFVTKSQDWGDLLACLRAHSRRYHEALRQDLPADRAVEEEAGLFRVLMVDDSTTVCLAAKQLLGDERNVEFAYCTDPTRALDEARRIGPTVLLVDLEMPEIDGLSLLQQLREEPTLQDVPVIMLSGIDDPAIKVRAFALGASDYVGKEMDKVEFFSRIEYHSRAYLDRRRLEASIAALLETRKRLRIQRNFVRQTFGRYLSDEVVASLLETPDGLRLGGEQREISILMADLRGFTSMSERLPAEDVLAVINNFLRVMTEILLRRQGTIDEFIGDAILAMFGAPVQREDDAQRAVAAAVEMQLAMAEVNAWNRTRGYPEVQMGIGINTGEVVVGNIGSERRAKYGIVGRHVNLAGRIESHTVGGQILISQSTANACGPLLRLDGKREVRPKGVDRPMVIHEVGGIGGGFDLFLPARRAATLRSLEPPLPVEVTALAGKFAGADAAPGTWRAHGEGTVRLATTLPLEPLTDLKFTLLDPQGAPRPGAVYGKVVAIDAATGEALVHLTAVPPEAAAVLAAHG